MENINFIKYSPKGKSKNKTLIITHGIAEYSKSYIELAENLSLNGFHVITYDLRGHGKSSYNRGTINSYDEVLSDLDHLVNMAYNDTEKVFLYGHSLGGVITNLYTNKIRKTDGIIIVASPIKRTILLKVLSLMPKRFKENFKIKTNFNDENLTHNYKYIKDEYDLDYFYFKYIDEVLIKGLKSLPKKLNDLPSLYIYSKKDKMGKLSHGKKLFKKTLTKDKTLLIYEKSFHNLHLDIEKKKLLNDLINFLDNH